jgi:hypothetical protein
MHAMLRRPPIFAPRNARDIVLVSGADAFAQRGPEDLARAYLRPESTAR